MARCRARRGGRGRGADQRSQVSAERFAEQIGIRRQKCASAGLTSFKDYALSGLDFKRAQLLQPRMGVIV